MKNRSPVVRPHRPSASRRYAASQDELRTGPRVKQWLSWRRLVALRGASTVMDPSLSLSLSSPPSSPFFSYQEVAIKQHDGGVFSVLNNIPIGFLQQQQQQQQQQQ